jgi:hypothetical protein
MFAIHDRVPLLSGYGTTKVLRNGSSENKRRSCRGLLMPTALRNIRQGHSGKHVLALSFSGFEPESEITIRR